MSNNESIKKFYKSEKFIIDRKDSWLTLQYIINKIKNKGVQSLTPEENYEFPNLYRKICSDSELAKTLKLSPDTLEYINILLEHSHNILYSSPKKTFRDVLNIFIKEFSISFFNNWKPVFIIFLIFFGIGLVYFIAIYNNPEYAVHVLPEYMIEKMKESYSEDITEHRDIYANIEMASFYIKNNVSIAFFSFALGITYGIGSVLMIFYNARVIGSIAAVIVSSGYGDNFFSFVLAHSSFELLGIVLAGGGGLAIGLSMIFSTREKRWKTVSKKAVEITPIVLMAAFFITIAAFIEGFISPTKIPIIIKAIIALISLLVILFFSFKVAYYKMGQQIKRNLI